MGPSPSGVAGWLLSCFVLLFLLPCCAPAFLLALPAPIIYTIAALVPPVLLLSASTAGQQAGTTATAKTPSAGSGQGDATSCHSSASTVAHKALNRRRHARNSPTAAVEQSKATGQLRVSRPQDASETEAAAPSAQDVFSSLAILGSSSASGPPCGVSCSSSNCPWHLPMALSLSNWGQDSSRFRGSRDASGGGKRPSSTDEFLSSHFAVQHAAVQLQAFSFPGPAEASTVGLLRSLSAPAAPAGHCRKEVPGLPACADTAAEAAASVLTAAAASTAAEAHSTQTTESVGLQLQHKRVQAELAATTAPDSPGPFWGSKLSANAAAAAIVEAAAANAAPAQHAPTSLCMEGQLVLAGGSGMQTQCKQNSAGDPCTCLGAAHRARASTPGRMQSLRLSPEQAALLQQQWRQAQQQGGLQHEHGTPQAQLQREVLAVLNHLHDGTQQQQLNMQPVDQENQQAAGQHTLRQSQQQHQPLQHSQQQMPTSPMTPLPFIATTARNSMCMRQPSFRLHAAGSPLSTSLSGGGCFAAWVPPLPSPAESPLARRLSERDDTGLPVSSPALQELLSSGGSRRPLRRGCSLDSRRSVSSPGTHACCDLDAMRIQQQLQQQQQVGEEQEAPWAGMQLRSVAHLLHQRQQHVQAQQLTAHELEGSPWHRQYQLERRHTFSTAVELSIAADGAVAAVDAATVAAAACSSMQDDGGSPPRRQLVWSSSGYGIGSGMEGAGSPEFVSVGSVTPHRLSCCSSMAREPSEADAVDTADATDSDGADATAAVLCGSPTCTADTAAVLCSSPRCADAVPAVLLTGCTDMAATGQRSKPDGQGAAAVVQCSSRGRADAVYAVFSDSSHGPDAAAPDCTHASAGAMCGNPGSAEAAAGVALPGGSQGCADGMRCTETTAGVAGNSQVNSVSSVSTVERKLEKTLTSHCIEFDFSDELLD